MNGRARLTTEMSLVTAARLTSFDPVSVGIRSDGAVPWSLNPIPVNHRPISRVSYVPLKPRFDMSRHQGSQQTARAAA